MQKLDLIDSYIDSVFLRKNEIHIKNEKDLISEASKFYIELLTSEKTFWPKVENGEVNFDNIILYFKQESVK